MPPVLGFAICQLAGLDPAAWHPVIPAGSWMGVTIVNASPHILYIATDREDARSVWPIAPDNQFMIQAVFGPGGGGAVRFASGAPAFYAKPASGDGTGVTCVWA